MVHVSCMIQEGQSASQKVSELEAGLSALLSDFFGCSAEFDWMTVAEGSGFTEAKPSTSSLVSTTVPEDITQERRIEFLTAVCDMWATTTGCHVNEVVAVASSA